MKNPCQKFIAALVLTFALSFTFPVFAQDFIGISEKSDTPTEDVDKESEDLIETEILPDSPLYSLKIGLENLVTFLTLKPASRAERYVELAERRTAEIRAMVEKGIATEEAIEKNVLKFEESMEKALIYAEKMRKKGEEAEEILAKISETTEKYKGVLEEFYDSIPEPARIILEDGLKWTKETYEEALAAIPEETKEEVAGEAKIIMEKIKEAWESLKAKF